MGLIGQLAETARIEPNRIGSLVLIASKDVDAFLRAAENHRVVILGIEGFRIDAGYAVPKVNVIADFSGLSKNLDHGATTIEEARRFLIEVSKPGMYFEFTIAQTEA